MSLLRISRLVRLATFLAIAAATVRTGPALARSPVPEPVRRPARIEVALRNNVVGKDAGTLELLAQLFPGAVPDDFTFLAGDFIVPKTTTAELAAFARARGNRIGVGWFCDAYAATTDETPSLDGLLDVLASDGGDQGELAGDALACPSPGGPRHRPAHGQCPDTIEGAACRVARRFARVAAGIGRFADFARGIEGETLAGARCMATGELRVFDAAACKELLAPWRRRRAFSRTLQSAARGGGCLRLRAGAHPGLATGVASPPSTPIAFTSQLTIASVSCQ